MALFDSYAIMEKVIIIGAGPAGIACSIMLKHLGINPFLIERHKTGGLLRNAYLVRNYPGLNNITGKDLVKKLAKHLQDFKIKPVRQTVLKIGFEKHFIIKTDKKVLKSKFLVLAVGTKPKKPNIKIPKKAEKKVFYDVADFPSVINKTIAIIGAGDAAFDYALTLSQKNKVIILNRSSDAKCNDFLFKKVSGIKKIRYFKNFKFDKIELRGKKIVLNGGKEIICDYLLIATGREPNYPLVTQATFENKNFFAAGDIKNGLMRQASIAVSDGIKTAMKIYERING